MKKLLLLTALFAILTTAAVADVRVPDTPKPTPKPKATKSVETNLAIKLDKDATEARLIIPKSSLKALRAQLDELDGVDSDNTASVSRTQTIVSGMFLSLAVVFGGVWFARSRKSGLKPNKVVVAGAIIFSVGALASVAIANIGPPRDARSITSKLFSPAVHTYKQAYGKIKIETSEDPDVMLVVPDKDEPETDSKPNE